MKFVKLLAWIGNNSSDIPTLGRRSQFKVSLVDDNKIKIINSNERINVVDEHFFNLVYNRYNLADVISMYKTSYYTDPIWKECPNRISSPYIAAVIRAYLEQ